MSWQAWKLDGWTWAWIFWMVWFVGVETAALITGSKNELTEHLRPIFLSQPVVWFIAVGLWVWLGVHLLAPPLEAWLARMVGG